MTVKYKTVITKAGAEKLAAATVPNGKKVNFVAMAVGDGGGTLPEPNASQTKLVNEVWRHALNKISQDNKHKNYVVAELVIPPETGGFWLREMGLYDDTGTLIAVGNMAESYKPELAEGSGRAQTLRMVIMVSDIESVELSIDTTLVMATQDYVDDKLAEHEKSRRHPDATLKEKGFTQLSSATDSTSESVAATPKAVKVAYDLADGKYTAQDASTKQKGIVQLSSATDSASESVAATSKVVKAAYDLAKGKYTAQDASTTQKGIVQLSSATDSTSETHAATPKAVKVVNDDLTGLKKSLGTAAKADVTTSTSDPTAGRVLKVGDGGLLGQALSVTDANLLEKNGLGSMLFNQGGGSNSIHFGSYGCGVHLNYGSSGDGSQAMSANLFVDSSGNLSVEWLAVRKADGTIASQRMQRLWGPLNKPTPDDIGALPAPLNALTVNLNTLGDRNNHGIYYQPSNAGATAANNYPVAIAGTLFVTQSAYGCQQMYITYTGRIFLRSVTGTWNGSGPWAGWIEMYGPNNRPTSNDVNCIQRDGSHIGGFVSGNAAQPYLRHTASNAVVVMAKAGDAYTRSESDGRFQPKGSFAAPNAASKGDNGWWQDGSTGIIDQWCMGATMTSETTQTITFPKAFPSACLHVDVGTVNVNNNRDTEGMFQLISKTNTGCVVMANRAYGSVGQVAALIRAVGY
jgi:phage-related tail fiber protein